METMAVLPCLKFSWFSNDDSVGHGEKKEEADRRDRKTILKSGQGWTFAS